MLRLDAIQFRLTFNDNQMDLNLHHLKACTLLAIWRAYWASVFDEKPFVPMVVAEEATSLILKLAKEQEQDTGL
ncbi:hypothetical protein VTP01DRAFT_4749 [Rhizomucor pusillus]|uniref:uncharacterized protein n=1 Tax=Rhizomucor pusillus TaxID=4840 RepID=UPI0037434D8F